MTLGDLNLSAGTGPDEDSRIAFWRTFSGMGALSQGAGLKALNRMALLKSAARHHQLSEAQCEALAIYMTIHGSRWKSMLRRAWMTASAPAELHRLRNSHGPGWLDRFRLVGDR